MEIKIGDEVTYYSSIENKDILGIDTCIDNNYPYAFVLKSSGDFSTIILDNLVKTGRHYNQIDDLLNNIKALEQEPKIGQWIPVSERLPKIEGCYLVTVKNEHERIYSKTAWYQGKNNWFARQDVIAWMPLPKPYKAKSEEV